MKWSLVGWEQKIESLVDQCADKVILEMEEVVMARLREAGETAIQRLFKAPASLESPKIELHEEAKEPETLISENKDTTPPSDEEVLYAFGILHSKQALMGDLLGMEGRPCRIVENGNLGMLVCPVPRKEYDEESLHLYMEDMTWVESHARFHEEILLKTMEGRAVIPLPFCTIFTNEENIKRQLDQNSQEIQGDLLRLGHNHEMHVKLFADRKRLLEKLQEELPYSGGQSGGRYFEKRQWEKKIEEEVERVMDDYGESLYQGLNNIAAEVILMDKAGVVEPEGLRVVFAAQYLVSKECHEEWDKKLEEFDQAGDPLGFTLDVSGPWPPYHFSRLTNEEETMDG